MKNRIMKAFAGGAAAILIFVAAFTFAEIHFVKTATAGLPSAATEMSAVPAFADMTTASAAPEIFNVVSDVGNIVVYNSDGDITMTMPLPKDLPPTDLSALDRGITIFGIESLLIFLEDYSE